MYREHPQSTPKPPKHQPWNAKDPSRDPQGSHGTSPRDPQGCPSTPTGPQGPPKGPPRSAKGPPRTLKGPLKGPQRPSKGPHVVDFGTTKPLSMTRPGGMRGAIK